MDRHSRLRGVREYRPDREEPVTLNHLAVPLWVCAAGLAASAATALGEIIQSHSKGKREAAAQKKLWNRDGDIF